jgi:hypothetical protein
MVDLLLAIIAIGTALVVSLVSAVIYITWRKRKEGRLSSTNYKTFFIMGLAWFLVGSALMAVSLFIGMPILFAIPLFALGAICLIIGLLNKDKWNK